MKVNRALIAGLVVVVLWASAFRRSGSRRL
jgi:hypothetical protein